MFLVWEGVDKVGKDTAKARFDQFSSYLHTNLNRGPIGYLSYDEIHGRLDDDTHQMRLDDWSKIEQDSLVIYLYADAKVLEQRILDAGDEPILADELIHHMMIYESNLAKYVDHKRLLMIDTTEMNLEAICEQIISKLISLQVESNIGPFEGCERFINYSDGHACKVYYPMFKSFNSLQLKSFGEFDSSVDSLYYEQLEKACLHKLYLFKERWIGFRQICVTQNDCISFVQFVFHNEKVHIMVTQRSWNANGNGVNDLTFFVHLMKEAKRLNLLPDGIDEDDFVLYWWCTMPHKFGA